MQRAAAIYARVSQDRTGEALGVRRRLQDCRAETERRGWPVVAEFVDDDVSAHSGKVRPQYRAGPSSSPARNRRKNTPTSARTCRGSCSPAPRYVNVPNRFNRFAAQCLRNRPRARRPHHPGPAPDQPPDHHRDHRDVNAAPTRNNRQPPRQQHTTSATTPKRWPESELMTMTP
ncbi:recombinase family protein [Pedococcus sp. 2YAF34]|uniref:recombinase family protein n=1 Tax=Pedococcus sp. 2YAF34 TaxID=3233032 RepID=UPI003F9AD3E5